MDILQRVDVFGDSKELSDVLSRIAESTDGLDERDFYYLKECELHIEGMWELVNELAKEIKKLRKQIG